MLPFLPPSSLVVLDTSLEGVLGNSLSCLPRCISNDLVEDVKEDLCWEDCSENDFGILDASCCCCEPELASGGYQLSQLGVV